MCNIVLCENCEQDSERLKALLADIMEKAERAYTLTEHRSGEEFLARMRPYVYDIAIFDVEMNKVSGIEAAQRLRAADKSAVIIFTTVHAQNVFSSFSAEPLQYLIKPIKRDELESVMLKALEKADERRNRQFALTFNNTLYTVPVAEIAYFQSLGRTVEAVTREGNMSFYSKLGEVQQNPLVSHFIRCYQSYLVNPDYIKSIENSDIHLTTGELLPISRGKAKEIKEQFIHYISGLIP